MTGKSSNGFFKKGSVLIKHWTGKQPHRGTDPGDCGGEAARWSGGTVVLSVAHSPPGFFCSRFNADVGSVRSVDSWQSRGPWR